jgi:hypothetical protein
MTRNGTIAIDGTLALPAGRSRVAARITGLRPRLADGLLLLISP